MVRPGTVYDARGRWYDGNLVRWHEGVLQPIGGWTPMRVVSPSEADVNVVSPVRGTRAFRGTDRYAILGMGTYNKLWLYRGGVLSDITPAALVTGRVDSRLTTGLYGSGAFGAGPFGSGVEGSADVLHATTWQLDNYGEYLVACSSDDKRLVWQTNPIAGSVAVVIPNAPTNNNGIVVTPERFVVALGAGGDPRKVQWSDQEDGATWTPSSTNQAGDVTLATPGTLMAGRRGARETLLWTDVDLWRMQYVGGEFVYSFTQIGSACGAVAPHAMTMAGGKAFWMGNKSFFVYDGFVRPLPSEVGDYVFGRINELQRAKICAVVRSQFNEVVWHYPSTNSSENDSYVAYNYVEGHWHTGTLSRTAGEDSPVFGFPIAADANGNVFQHEVAGGTYLVGGVAQTPYIESGPVELGLGDQVFMARHLYSDTNTLGGVTMSFLASMYPGADETTYGPYSLARPTSVRFTARQLRLKVSQVDANWRVGTQRIDVMPGGSR